MSEHLNNRVHDCWSCALKRPASEGRRIELSNGAKQDCTEGVYLALHWVGSHYSINTNLRVIGHFAVALTSRGRKRESWSEHTAHKSHSCLGSFLN